MPDELSPAEREAMTEADKAAWCALDVGEMTGEQAEIASWALTHGLTAGFLAARAFYGPDARAECERLRTGVTMNEAVTPVAAENIKRLTMADTTTIGSIMGRLELISTHRRHRYSVYDALTHREVKCEFPEDQLEKVKAALTRRVMVSGVIHRNTKGEPLRVSQPRLTVIPKEEELPTTDQLIGVDPEFTGDMTAADYLRQAWDA